VQFGWAPHSAQQCSTVWPAWIISFFSSPPGSATGTPPIPYPGSKFVSLKKVKARHAAGGWLGGSGVPGDGGGNGGDGSAGGRPGKGGEDGGNGGRDGGGDEGGEVNRMYENSAEESPEAMLKSLLK
jgi:hypothetical protein